MEIIIDGGAVSDKSFSYERRLEIEKCASSVFAPYCPVQISNLDMIPVAEIVKRHNVVVVPYSLIKEEQLKALRAVSDDFTEYGMFYQNKEGRSFIYYNDAKSKEMCEAVLFHELGHLFLKHTQQSDIAEREADYFAAMCLGFILALRLVKKGGYEVEFHEKSAE